MRNLAHRGHLPPSLTRLGGSHPIVQTGRGVPTPLWTNYTTRHKIQPTPIHAVLLSYLASYFLFTTFLRCSVSLTCFSRIPLFFAVILITWTPLVPLISLFSFIPLPLVRSFSLL